MRGGFIGTKLLAQGGDMALDPVNAYSASRFATRAPIPASVQLINALHERYGKAAGDKFPTYHIATDVEVDLIMLRRLDAHVHSNELDPSFVDPLHRLNKGIDEQRLRTRVEREEGRATAFLMTVGAGINYFFNTPEMYEKHTGPDDGNVSDHMRHQKIRMAQNGMAGTSDIAIGMESALGGFQPSVVIVNKPLLSAERMQRMIDYTRVDNFDHPERFTGYRIVCKPSSESGKDDDGWEWSVEPKDHISTVEMHIIVQAMDQLYDNSARWLTLFGQGYIFACLGKPNGLLLSRMSALVSGRWDFHGCSGLIALALPPLPEEELAKSAVPTLEELGISFDGPAAFSSGTPTRSSRAREQARQAARRPPKASTSHAAHSTKPFSTLLPADTTQITRLHMPPGLSSHIPHIDPRRSDTNLPGPDFVRVPLDMKHDGYGINPPTHPSDVLPSSIANIHLQRYQSSGQHSDAYTGFLNVVSVAVKVVQGYTVEDDEYDPDDEGSERLHHEGLVYERLATAAGGSVVPAIFGLFASETRVFALVLEDGGESLDRTCENDDDWSSLSVDVRQQILKSYEVLHANGILHNDLSLRHVLLDSQGQVRLIDFDEACFDAPAGDLEDEMHDVRAAWGWT